jgi:hypothetical protein
VAALTAARRWLVIDAGKWTADQKARVGEVFAASDSVRKLVEMRQELALSGSVPISTDQLLVQLQQWLRAGRSQRRCVRCRTSRDLLGAVAEQRADSTSSVCSPRRGGGSRSGRVSPTS